MKDKTWKLVPPFKAKLLVSPSKVLVSPSEAIFIKDHHQPPHVSFFIFSELMPLGVTNVNCGMDFLARPAGMWGALDLDHALEAATRAIGAKYGWDEHNGKPIFLRLDFVLPAAPSDSAS
jgi:hypothetical protein